MNRGTTFVALFVIVAIGVIAASQLLQNRPPIEITVGADPLIEDWLRSAVSEFNGNEQRLADGRQVLVSLQIEDDISVWRDRRWTTDSHPDAWIASASASVQYAEASNVPFEIVVQSIAKTPIVIGAFQSRADVLSDVPLDWEDIHRIAEAERWSAVGGESSWQFVNLAFPLPDETMVGLGTLLSGIAHVTSMQNLTGTQLADITSRRWLEPLVRSVPSFNSIGDNPAEFMALRGTSSADIGMATESQWLMSLSSLTSGDAIQLSYPDYLFVLDFPLSRWQDMNTTNETQAAIDVFAGWLMSSERQDSLPAFGLRPAEARLPENSSFSSGVSYGIELDLSGFNLIQAPSRSTDILSLLSWFETQR